jgi:two-component system sensor histidine kinase CpxA
MLVLMLPKLDSRQMTELLDSEQRQGVMIEQHVSRAGKRSAERFDVVAQAVSRYRQVGAAGQRLLLVTSEGRVIGADRNEMQIIRNFIGQADNADHPKKNMAG